MRCNPGLNACLEASWEGPFVVVDKLSQVTYKIALNGRKTKGKVVHINLLKATVLVSSICAVVAITVQTSLLNSLLNLRVLYCP